MTFRNDKKSKKDITLLTNCPMCTLVRYSSGAQYGNTGCRIFKWVGGTKLERFLPRNQHAQRKLLNFENRISGEVSKIGHHFSK